MDVIRGVDRMIVQCPGERVEIIDDYGAHPAKAVVIPSAAYVEVFQPIARDEARRYTRLDTRPEVVYVGRMLRRKASTTSCAPSPRLCIRPGFRSSS